MDLPDARDWEPYPDGSLHQHTHRHNSHRSAVGSRHEQWGLSGNVRAADGIVNWHTHAVMSAWRSLMMKETFDRLASAVVAAESPIALYCADSMRRPMEVDVCRPDSALEC